MGKRKPAASSSKNRRKDGKVKKTTPALYSVKTHRCEICYKEFTNRSNLLSHLNVHSTETPYSCPQCSYSGKTKKYLSRHIKKVHNDNLKTHKCNYCGKMFLHPSGLNVHVMVHTGEKPHSCNICGKTFRVTYSLNSHMLIHTDSKPFECAFCEYACRDSSTLRKHQNKHMGLEKIYECKICDKGYKNRSALKIHIAETHLEVDMKKYPCDRCDKMFKSNAHRQTHIKSVHDRSMSCHCSICGFKVQNKNNLPAHLRTHLRERPFRCTFAGCTRAFKDKNSLTKHSVIHNPDLHHPCQYCGRKFARKTHVQRHERVMHRDRAKCVQCDYCGSKFYSKNYLRKHIQTKHVYKQKFKYICDICGLVTHNKPSIVMHLKYGHLNDHDMQCKICDNKKIYKRHLYLKMHYWKTHNIKYKITKKPTHFKSMIKAKDEDIPSVEVKVEPIEADSYEELQLLEIHKQEHEDEADDSLGYSKRVLSEDITKSVLSSKTDGNEIDFDEFFIRHVFPKREEKDDNAVNSEINQEENDYVKQRVKQMLIRTQQLEKAKAARKKRILEEKQQKEEELIKLERERQEIVELRRVREIYNERMKAAVDREKKKKEYIKIKYLKSKPVNLNKTNEILTEKGNESTENPDCSEKNTKNQGNHQNHDISEEVDEDIDSDDLTNINEETYQKQSDLNNSTENDINISNDSEPNDGDNDFTANTDLKIDSEEHIENIQPKDTKNLNNNKNTENIEYHEETNITIQEKESQKEKVDETINEQTHKDDEQIKSSNTNLDKIDKSKIQVSEEENDNSEDITNKDFNTSHYEAIELNKGSVNKEVENHNNDTQNNANDIDYNANGNLDENSTNVEKNNHERKVDTHNDDNQNNANNIDSHNNNANVNVDDNNANDIDNNQNSANVNANENDINVENTVTKEILQNEDTVDQTLQGRRIKNKNKNYKETESDDDDWSNDEDIHETEKSKKMEFKTFQCYICFKLYETKNQLIEHCQDHFNICNTRTLTKCPICAHVSIKSLSAHMKKKHNVDIKIPVFKLKDRKDAKDGSRYCYDIDGTEVEVIPSIKILNKLASVDIDKQRREKNDKSIAKTKLVKKGKEWIVEKEAINITFEELPELTDMELFKCRVSDNDIDRLGQLNYLAKKKGLKMMFPCFICDKVCQSFSALKLHKRRHEDNPKPFRPRAKNTVKPTKKLKLNIANRTAMPKPILNKHKCDDKLKEFYESNIRGGDIEFWQFLKIFNKMDREKINDFKDLEERSDFGNHLDYYKDVENLDDDDDDDMSN